MDNVWNPWHGCRKISAGCKQCYVYRQDALFGTEISSAEVRKTGNFTLPLKRKRDKSFKLESGCLIFTCITSDFWIEEADEWRKEAWEMIRQRQDLLFFIFTKRVDRFYVSLPDDWGLGYDNVILACSVENQEMADYRLPILKSLPVKDKRIMCAPLLEPITLGSYLDSDIKEVTTSGESGDNARLCDYDWVLDIRRQCIEHHIPFYFHQTGARLRKDGKIYHIIRSKQHSQAAKANINYAIER